MPGCALTLYLFALLQVLRLKIPVEVQAAESSCQRSKVTGSLTVTMPKVRLQFML